MLANLLYAQSPSYLRYTTESGLPTDYVYVVVEDADDAICASTENGLPGNDITWAFRVLGGKTWLYVYYNWAA